MLILVAVLSCKGPEACGRIIRINPRTIGSIDHGTHGKGVCMEPHHEERYNICFVISDASPALVVCTPPSP